MENPGSSVSFCVALLFFFLFCSALDVCEDLLGDWMMFAYLDLQDYDGPQFLRVSVLDRSSSALVFSGVSGVFQILPEGQVPSPGQIGPDGKPIPLEETALSPEKDSADAADGHDGDTWWIVILCSAVFSALWLLAFLKRRRKVTTIIFDCLCCPLLPSAHVCYNIVSGGGGCWGIYRPA